MAPLIRQQHQNLDIDEFYTPRDPPLLTSNFSDNLAFLANNWRHMLGRPTITLVATDYLLGKRHTQQTQTR